MLISTNLKTQIITNMAPSELKFSKLIYPELSYKIIGIIYKVYNELGPGYQEKYYQKAIALEF